MSKISDYFKVSLDPQSPAMPVRIITGLVVSVLGFLWLPFGMLGLLILLWIVYVTKPPEISALSGAELDGNDIHIALGNNQRQLSAHTFTRLHPAIQHLFLGKCRALA